MADYSVKVRGVFRASRRPPVHETVTIEGALSPEEASNRAAAKVREQFGCDDTLIGGVNLIDAAGPRGGVNDLGPTREEAINRCRMVLDLLAPSDREAVVLALMEGAQPEPVQRKRRVA